MNPLVISSLQLAGFEIHDPEPQLDFVNGLVSDEQLWVHIKWLDRRWEWANRTYGTRLDQLVALNGLVRQAGTYGAQG